MTNADWRFSINWPFREEASSDFYAWTAPEAARCGMPAFFATMDLDLAESRSRSMGKFVREVRRLSAA
jgi:hypothetical protein